MSHRLAGRTLAFVAVFGCLLVSSPSIAADSSEKLTSLPLHPGLTFQQEQDAPVCRTKAQINIYNAPSTATLAEYLTWYERQLKGFHHVHKTWSERAQETFYSPDGSKGVTVTGSKGGARVFAVSYMKMSANLTVHEMDAFGPDNPSCK
jgi:hypothetical protein